MDMCSWHKVERYKKSMKLRVIREGRNKEDMGNALLWVCGHAETRNIWETLLTGGWSCWKQGKYGKPLLRVGGYAGKMEDIRNLFNWWVGGKMEMMKIWRNIYMGW